MYKSFKFVIVGENDPVRGYLTEKFTLAVLAQVYMMKMHHAPLSLPLPTLSF